MDELELRQAIAGRETLRLELKAGLSSERKREICKEVAALATMRGGRLVIGATDDGVVVGVTDAPRVAEQVTSWVGDWVDPAPVLDCEIVSLDGKDVVVFTIGESLASLFFYDGKPYIRVGTQSRPAGPAQAEYLAATGKLASEMRARAAELVAMRGELDPGLRTAAAIFGQGELATMNYAQLVERLKKDLGLPR